MKYQVFVSGAPKSRAESDFSESEAYHAGTRQDGAEHRRTSPPFRNSAQEGGASHSHQRENGYTGGDGAAYAGHGGTPMLRRFPPVIQFLTDVDPYVEHQFQTLCVRAHRQGKNLQDVCQDLYVYARSIGYLLTLGVQEVFSNQMPSFPEQTVQSALLMVDLTRITSPNGYHEGRVAV